MKVLFVNNFRYRGGGEEFLMELLPGLIGKGVVIGIVCRPNTPLATMFKDMPIEVYPIEKSGLSGISSFFQIARIIKHKGYDILCIQRGHDIMQSWFASLLSNRRPKLIFIVHVADFINSRFLPEPHAQSRDDIPAYCTENPLLFSQTVRQDIDHTPRHRPHHVQSFKERKRLHPEPIRSPE